MYCVLVSFLYQSYFFLTSFMSYQKLFSVKYCAFKFSKIWMDYLLYFVVQYLLGIPYFAVQYACVINILSFMHDCQPLYVEASISLTATSAPLSKLFHVAAMSQRSRSEVADSLKLNLKLYVFKPRTLYLLSVCLIWYWLCIMKEPKGVDVT